MTVTKFLFFNGLTATAGALVGLLMVSTARAEARFSVLGNPGLTPVEAATIGATVEPGGPMDRPLKDTDEALPVSPPGPLKPVEPAVEVGAPTSEPTAPAADSLPDLSEPLPAQVPLEPSNAEDRVPAENDLPTFLIGQTADTAIAMLEQDGWNVIARTPGTVQLDRGQMGLNLEVDDTTGRVEAAELVEL